MLTEEEIRILWDVEKRLTHTYGRKYCTSVHDLSHVKRMVAIAEIIANPGHLFLLKVAIWLHNIDRSKLLRLGTDQKKTDWIHDFLGKYNFTEEEEDIIVDAVLRHSRLNEDDDSLVLRDLKDCDRLEGAGAIGLLRLESLLKNLPFYNLANDFPVKHPLKPNDITSFLREIEFMREWQGMLRNPRAIALGRKWLLFTEMFLVELKAELQELGVI